MIELETGIITGVIKDNVSVKNAVVLISGILKGSLEVSNKSAVLLSGIVNGNIVSEGQLLVSGIVDGSIEIRAGNVEISGIVKGNILNEGGKVKLHEKAIVKGELRGDIEIIPAKDEIDFSIDP
jgi:cytoskeletal protein CcmA (bactofilin family)